MRTTTIAILIAALAAGTATAAPWQSIGQRKAVLDKQIDSGVTGGSLTAAEAARMRTDLAAIEQREGDYRRSGGRLTSRERTDLDTRFKTLTKKLTEEQSDRQVK